MKNFEPFFNQIAEDLDLTDTEETTITSSYNAVGNFLVNSPELSKFSPNVFVQGSMRLGTVVKPLKKDDYDIDLVCELNSESMTPASVKRKVGDVLKRSERYSLQLEEEHGRCWTLDYQANPPYHIDILSGISIKDERVKATVKKIDGTYDWLFTNPKGFANWFLSLAKETIFESGNRNVEPVKKMPRRNSLQRAVQLIKRHRDVYFKDDPDKGPASVIITALTGLSYNNESTIEGILKNGPIQWISHIRTIGDKLSIKIPSLPDDDYADKWNEDGDEVVWSFLRWHRQLLIDLDDLFSKTTYALFISTAKKLFSESSVDRISQKNTRILDSLKESFNEKGPYTSVNFVHPLFPHARTLPYGVSFVPDSKVTIKVTGRVYSSENDAENFSDRYEFEFYEYSPILKKREASSF